MGKSNQAKDDAAEAAAWFFENADAVFMVVRDACAARISPGWTNLLGWSEAEALGRPIWDFVHPDDMRIVRAGVKEIMVAGQATYDHRVLMRSGGYLWMRVRAKASADGSGMVVMHDISAEHRQASEKAEIAKVNALLNQAAGVRFWRYDPVSDEYELDADFSQPFGRVEADRRMPGAGLRDRMDPADLPGFMAALTQGIESGEPTVVAYRGRGTDGQWRQLRSAWVSARKLPCGRHEIVGLTQDLTELTTERDRALAGEEAAKAGQRAKAEFLANISHELRTPMNGLLGSLHLAKSAPTGERDRLIEQALSSGETLAEFLGDIIEFAEGENGGAEAERTPVSLRQLLENAVGLNASQAKAKGIWLRHAEPADERVLLDGPRTRQILRVLIGNALKFTASGGVDIAVSLQGDEAHRRLLVEVRDTGVGIAAADQRLLFDCFQQADGSSTRQFGGVGLGLARARQLAELMGGTITCESAPGQGSTFRLTLPTEVLAAEDLPAAAPDASAALRVLAVDDNAANLALVCALLSAFGADIETACNGAEAVAAASHGGFDLILMDIQMPVMDGVEATRRIRALSGPEAGVRIVALTANVLTPQKALYETVGMNGCLAKPLSPPALGAELAKVCELLDQAA